MVVRIGQNRDSAPRRTFFKEWREFRRLSQDELAARLGTNKSAVSKMELGRNRYNQSSLEAWADALGCEPHELISRAPTDDDNAPKPEAIWPLFARASKETKAIVERILRTEPKR